MATIGVASVLRGSATLAFGAGTRAINMPVGDDPIFLGPVMFPPIELVGAGVSLIFLGCFYVVLSEDPHGHCHARGSRQPAGGHGDGH